MKILLKLHPWKLLTRAMLLSSATMPKAQPRDRIIFTRPKCSLSVKAKRAKLPWPIKFLSLTALCPTWTTEPEASALKPTSFPVANEINPRAQTPVTFTSISGTLAAKRSTMPPIASFSPNAPSTSSSPTTAKTTLTLTTGWISSNYLQAAAPWSSSSMKKARSRAILIDLSCWALPR